ncbi:TetR/AcrR family transcriptional regulator [Nocardia donostiensis]|uniref:TetR family transcriptional regulator n=1 Tax=Nocardia donostiensis TaxID=1538463 RepID=A0A1W0B637_9NOCA|nr:TetR/AcrR family transcriptional regulator [Nocardia donostiensis]ONM50001.1 TetR family transcriptional regulator [Nocardia donostiensis]OQS15660.1 TetR family transcriptional regulator [Nocardia donostiensis]OQS17954.1 TetR family transcriptional regulator [Nocardia donostiensis]
MRSPSDDRTARARIRDAALGLFAEQGVDAVTVRDIAAEAGVSPALVIRHYGTKEKLREVVDEHVAAVFESVLEQVCPPDGSQDPAPTTATMAEAVTARLPPDSPIPAYLGRMLLGGGTAGTALFSKLYSASREALAEMSRAGTASVGTDPSVRAAFLLVNDLAVMILRPHIAAATGTDPLSQAGMRRWGDEVLTIYRSGLGGTTE